MNDDKNLKILTRLFLYTLSGICCGIVISAYKVGINKVATLMKHILDMASTNLISKLAFISIFIIIACIIYFLNNAEPNIKGSGIPTIYALIENRMKINLKKTLIYKFFASIVTVGMGLTLGREGPSVQLGGLIGNLVHSLTKTNDVHKKYFIGSSSGAALAVAFNAPLTGVLFSIEEIYKKTTKKEFLSSSVTVFSAIIVSNILLGIKPALVNVPKIKYFNLSLYSYLLIFGIFVGLSGVLFNTLILNSKNIINLLKIPDFIKFLIPFIVTAIFLLLDKNLFGSGENLIMLPLEGNKGISTLIFYYFTKLFLVFLVFSVDVPGGSLVPLLVLGSLVGNIYASILVSFGVITPNLILAFSMIGMAGHFSSIVRAPLTAIILVLEMTNGSFDYLLAVALVSLISYAVAEFMKIEPFYEKSYNELKVKLNARNKKNQT